MAELLGRLEGRRRFSVEQKLAVLAEARVPGANMSEVARRLQIGRSTLYRKLDHLGLADRQENQQEQDEPAEAN